MRITRAEIERRLDNAIEEYAEITGLQYDPLEGWLQIPRGENRMPYGSTPGGERREFVAAMKYGEIEALERLLTD